MNYRIDITYDGSHYNGWQRLGKSSGAITIQGTIEDALTEIFGREIQIHGSGRTDAGVHALGQVASFHAGFTEKSGNIEPEDIQHRLNALLPGDIRITGCAIAEDSFHARKSAVSKEYVYRLHTGERRVFNRKYTAWHKGRVDVGLMEKYSRKFIGTHDFRNFSSVKDADADTVRTIYSIEINASEDGYGGQDIEITYCGNGFLYNMVRILTGTLVEIGENNKKILENFDDKNGVNTAISGKMMPPEGLFLKKVSY